MKKVKFLFILISGILVFNCSAQKISELKKLKTTPSHKVKNEMIKEIVISYVKEQVKTKKSPLNIILLKVMNETNDVQNLYIKASNFEMEKDFYKVNENYKKPNGYANIHGFLVLIYGLELDNLFDKINPVGDILNEGNISESIISVHTTYYQYSYFTKTKDIKFVGITDVIN